MEFLLKISANQAPSNLLSPLAQHSHQNPNVDARETRALTREKGARTHNSERWGERLETKARWNVPEASHSPT